MSLAAETTPLATGQVCDVPQTVLGMGMGKEGGGQSHSPLILGVRRVYPDLVILVL